MRFFLGLVAVALLTNSASGQGTIALSPTETGDTLVAQFQGVTCTPEQRLAGAGPNLSGHDSIPGVVAPKLTSWPSPYRFRPASTDTPPIRVRLTYVVDSTGRVDLCTVRVIGAYTADWRDAILQLVPKMKYSPGTLSGRRPRTWVQTPFVFVPR